MNIIKLNYTNKETAIADLIAKGVYTEVDNKLVYSNGTQAVVDVGQIVEVPATYDDEGEQLTEAIYYDGIFYDIMTTETIDFGSNEVFPIESVHSFAGYNPNADGPVNETVIVE